MPSINLAPGTQYIITARKRRVRLYLIASAIIMIFLLGWIGLYTYVQVLNSSNNSVKAELESTNQKIQALHDEAKRVAFFEKRLVDVSSLLDNQIGWDRVFADIERLLPADTILTSLEATNGNTTISLQGTTQNVDQIALALASLTQGTNHPSVFKDGTVKTIQRQEINSDGAAPVLVYSFTMTLDFNATVLKKAAL